MSRKNVDITDMKNASVMADLIADEDTTEELRVSLIKEILEAREGQSFFKTMFEEGLSFGECASCGHENHWGIPEDDLNQMGWVSNDVDSNVSETTDEESCPEFAQACKKKRITV